MVNENIQYVQDHIRIYMMALRPVINQNAVAKRTTTRNNKKKLGENSVEAVKPYLVPPKIFN